MCVCVRVRVRERVRVCVCETGVARWRSGYGVGLTTRDRGFNPSRCAVDYDRFTLCNLILVLFDFAIAIF